MAVVSTVVSVYLTSVSYLIVIIRIIFKFPITLPI